VRLIAPVLCAGLALLASAWFALGAHQAHDLARAQAIVSGAATLSSAQADRAASLLRAAKTLNPDREVDVVRAQVAVEAGHLRAARRILLGVTREEPRNVEAWLWLARASSDDTPQYLRAVAHVRGLEPLLPRSG
jgi:hypothetical protein